MIIWDGALGVRRQTTLANAARDQENEATGKRLRDAVFLGTLDFQWQPLGDLAQGIQSHDTVEQYAQSIRLYYSQALAWIHSVGY